MNHHAPCSSLCFSLDRVVRLLSLSEKSSIPSTTVSALCRDRPVRLAREIAHNIANQTGSLLLQDCFLFLFSPSPSYKKCISLERYLFTDMQKSHMRIHDRPAFESNLGGLAGSGGP